MAQRKTSKLGRNLRVLARRYGFSAKGAVIATALMLLVSAGTVGACIMLRSGGMSIERAANADDTPDASAKGVADKDGVADGGDSRDGDSGVDDHASAFVTGVGDARSARDSRGTAEAIDAAGGVEPAASESARVLVHVDGAVVTPGVYVLENPDPRINDAVTHAGGLTPEADTSAVNLAAPVSDGEKVHIPVAGEVPVEVTVPAGGPGTGGSGGSPPGTLGGSAEPSAESGESPSSDSAPSGGGGLVNLNTASEQELCQLPGIGEVTAASIVREREANGPYASVEDVMRVSGIGEKRFDKIRDLICV
ncbi:MAG: helix-hairpin-helix domain-containing protein [Atopobiaceae bacterium]|nr:helix-hairpin-helix domain-containing protein [Atopobiaceae bacterium]